MQRFRFALEKVMRLRAQETDVAKRALGEALQAEMAARQALAEALERRSRATLDAVNRETAGGIAAHEFASVRTHLSFLGKQVDEARRLLAGAEEATRQRRVALLEARRREKVLEKLREHRLEQYQAELLREEQKEFDEYGNRPGLNGAASETDI